MEKINTFKMGISAALGAVSAALGWFGWFVLAYVAAMAMDYLTGSAAALKNGEWSSKTAREGCWHKLGSMVAVAAALLFDGIAGMIVNHIPAVSLPFEYTVLIAPVVIAWYIVTELGSVVENAGRMGAPVPAFLVRAIAALHGAVDAVGGAQQQEEEEKR